MSGLSTIFKMAVKAASPKASKAVSKANETASILKTLGKKESDISDFQTKYFRGDDKTRYSSEDLQKEAIKLDEGLIGLDDFIKARNEIKPLKT